ncbi:molybdenum ABC transporter ATP-binding protein [Sulfitobacter aestuariivivens]|uniref:Molybdenum ABC transporter ATP-binding protein n=1 Tax=Sulfitobacter aestuariivivens TaxID=2766981 RepID=A0A927D6I2_9RHOB|nr:molybdenum ABC transporter ATP-binding protein [Sulfitobacter aestuariivivens]MBD3663706.1 molybdenum ABC transporter ATP-binding protein [Sulfitobacter aestuariivivens]
MSLIVDIQHRFGDFDLTVAFEAGPGITALFGRSGAGKTTVVNAVAGLLTPDQGRVRFDDQTLFDSTTGQDLPADKRHFGYVFQDARLFPHLTVRQNLEFGAKYTQNAPVASLDETADLLGLQGLLARAPNTLSGGEKQRVALGRALLSQPRMLLMDEPLASLDGPRKQDILPFLEQLRDGLFTIPILYVSHAVDEVARLADRLVLLQDGQVRAQGPLFDVMADPAAVPLLGVREAGAVLEAEVCAHADDGLSTLRLSAGNLELPGVQAAVGSTVRLRVLAQDVILSLDRPDGLSSVNILPVKIDQVHPGDGPGAAIALSSGTDRLLARVTARAVKEMRLHQGMHCFAIIKATTVAPGSIGR